MADNPDRADLMRRIGRSLLLPPDRSGLTVSRSDGTRPVVLALSHDLLVDVLDQVQSVGGAADVVMPQGTGLAVLAMCGGDPAGNADDVPVHPAIEMGMFLSLVIQAGEVRCYVIEPGRHVTADEPHPLLAPA